MSKDLITRKNDLLKESYKRFDEISDIGRMLSDIKSIKYSTINKYTLAEMCHIAGNQLIRLSAIRHDISLEYDKALPEAEQEEPEPTIDDEPEVTENDLPFC